MKYKFNPFERAVGLFLLITIAGSFSVGIGVAVKKNWFEKKNVYYTYVETASNIREGSSVFMAGLKVGKIEKLELDHTHKIKVSFNVLKKYGGNLTEGTQVFFVRPFIIGDKVLTLTQGNSEGKVIPPGTLLPINDSFDLMDVFSGKRVEAMVGKLDSILSNLNDTLLLGKDIAYQVGDKKKLQKTLEDVAFASSQIRKVLPKVIEKTPALTEDLSKIVMNLEKITTGLREVEPEGSKKTIELLSESIVVLQAMQRSFLLKGAVKDIKAEQKESPTRLPASE